jgi:tetratricopeptide (TPR) repeat protein
VEFIPTRTFRLPVNKKLLLENGSIPSGFDSLVEDEIVWSLSSNGVMKNHMMVLDMLANNNWERPVYFAITTGGDSYIGLEEYFQLEGLAYRLMPFKNPLKDGQTGIINTDLMYDNVMNKFKWGNMHNPKVYMDETNMRMTMNFRNNFARLAEALIRENKLDSATKVLDRCVEVMPDEAIPYNFFMLPIGELYYKVGQVDKANTIFKRLTELYNEELAYFFALDRPRKLQVESEIQRALSVMQRMLYSGKTYSKDSVLVNQIETQFSGYYQRYMEEFPESMQGKGK